MIARIFRIYKQPELYLMFRKLSFGTLRMILRRFLYFVASVRFVWSSGTFYMLFLRYVVPDGLIFIEIFYFQKLKVL